MSAETLTVPTSATSPFHLFFNHLRPHPWQLQVCDQEQVADACEHALGCGPNFKYHYKNGKYIGAPHQYNCTYFSALKKDDQSYLLVSFITCPAQVGDSGLNCVKRLIPPFDNRI